MAESTEVTSIKAKLPKKKVLGMRNLEMSQDFSIENTPVSDFWICTTGITRTERALIRHPQHIRIQDKLTPNTQVLVAYRAIFTEKYVQALKWRIPVVSPLFLYDLQNSHTKYKILPFSGSHFTTSGISNEMFPNYFILLGAKYEPNCSIFTDFLICDNTTSEKYLFCKKYNIPIISTSQVFKDTYDIFIKKARYDALRLNVSGIFLGKIFLLDPSLPQPLFNKLRRLIIEEEGTRVSVISDKVNFILSADYIKYSAYQDYLIHYQYVFDCVESRAQLHPDFYKIQLPHHLSILEQVVAVVDTSTIPEYEIYLNKLRALGATVKSTLDMRVTHFITRKSHSQGTILDKKRPKISYTSVLPEWVDHCLTTLKMASTARFSVDGPMLSLKRRAQTQRQRNVRVQFTGLPAFLKAAAIEKLNEHGIEYVDTACYSGCTHLIMGQPSISEKFLCTLVSGGWILRTDFIEHIKDHMLSDCEQFEWVCSPETLAKDRKPIGSIRKWREQITKTGKGPFNRWVVKLYTIEQKQKTYTALIEAGGGKITQEGNHTHVFVDKEYKGEVKEEKYHNIDNILSYLFKKGS